MESTHEPSCDLREAVLDLLSVKEADEIGLLNALGGLVVVMSGGNRLTDKLRRSVISNLEARDYRSIKELIEDPAYLRALEVNPDLVATAVIVGNVLQDVITGDSIQRVDAETTFKYRDELISKQS